MLDAETPAPRCPNYDLGRPDSPPCDDEFSDEALEKLENDMFDKFYRKERPLDPQGQDSQKGANPNVHIPVETENVAMGGEGMQE